MKTHLKTVAIVAAMATVAVGCGGDDKKDDATTSAPASSSAPAAESSAAAPAAGKVVRVAFLTKFPVSFFTAMDDAAKKYDAATPGVEVEYFVGKDPKDVAGQTAQIEDAVAKKFDAIVVTPMGPEVQPPLKAAAEKGLKIILVDNDLPDFKEKTAVAATGNLAGGKKAGEYLKSILKPGDTLGVMEGVRGAPALDDRINGMKETLGTDIKIVLAGAETKCDLANGASAAEDLLVKNPNLTAIYSACDDPALGAVKVIKAKGKKVLVVGYDGLPDAAKAIQAGDMQATIAQFPGKMAELGVEAAMKAVNGEKVEAFIDTGTELVTKDNAEKFLTFQ